MAKVINARGFKPNVRSRHPSHQVIKSKGDLPYFPFRSIVRLGSTTATEDAFKNKTTEQLRRVVEVNSVQSVLNSSSKIQMKRCFNQANVKTADWYMMRLNINDRVNDMQTGQPIGLENLPYPIVAKLTNGSRGEGMQKLDTEAQLRAFLQRHSANPNAYILEKFYNYAREFRLHVTADGCFYTCRKALKENTPENERWYLNDTNCVWLKDDNAAFNRPSNWTTLEAEAVKALRAVGLDIGAVDVRVQNEQRRGGRNRTAVDFVVLETNSAPSFGEVTEVKYKQIIPQLLQKKRMNRG